jgi:hypothetical protein
MKKRQMLRLASPSDPGTKAGGAYSCEYRRMGTFGAVAAPLAATLPKRRRAGSANT